MAFPLLPDLAADQLEQQLLDTWNEEDLFRQSLAAGKGGKPFVFFEGPPTANGRPGIHHVFSRTIKDLVCRFRAMQGRSVTRIAGWDTHGLPVEIEVEKQLGLKGKKAIEEYGVERFNALCRASVFTYKSDWEQLSDRIGYWLDYEHPYITFSNEYVESVWSILRRLHDRDLLYRGHRVLPYCPRCGTVLSSHELAQGYEEVRDRAIFVTFPLEDGSGRELVVWTTTPWTLPSNVAAAVHPELEYGEYTDPRTPGRRLVMATSTAPKLLARLFGEGAVAAPDRVVAGADLVGLRYTRPLDVVPLPDDKEHSVVVAGDFVTATDGSGIVHMAPAFGADDYAAGQTHGLALLRPVAADGTFVGTTWPELEGLLVTADETNELIIRRLKTDGRHLLTEQYIHTYPHCWRCRSKLIYYARDSWFVRTSSLRDRMLSLNSQVEWHPPEVGAGRFGEWLSNNVDWALSRDRYWGTPLPVWSCDLDPAHVTVIGSYAELAERWGKPLPDEFDPHKPFIDDYTWSCDCGGTMTRATEVIDTWFDSGSMPYAQWHYPFEHETRVRGALPRRLHLRRGGPDARVVLLPARHFHRRVRRAGLSQRDRERAGARRRGPEDVQEPRQRGESDGPPGRAWGRCPAALPAGLQPGVAPEEVRRPHHPRGGRRLPEHACATPTGSSRSTPPNGPREAPGTARHSHMPTGGFSVASPPWSTK